MIIGRQSGLGRGLGALIPPGKPSGSSGSVMPPPSQEERQQMPPAMDVSDVMPVETGKRILEIPIEDIERNPHQPRVHFDHTQLEDLISSIKEHGIIQPLVVTALGGGKYQLIAGERRLRAATIAGLQTVPAVARYTTDQKKLELAIIEYVQRSDLNPFEEAR
ncbi:MAG: ParB/RepB/Spo0J family partition protein, partial [bacterium]|nr:ParB/RepB/Spo0J family partition protein [bacterium]